MVQFINGIPGQPKNERELRRAFQKLREFNENDNSFLVNYVVGGSAISGHKVVAIQSSQIVLADHATTPPGNVVGISNGAAAAGALIAVRTGGKLGGFVGLTPDAVYFLGSAGAINATPPTSGILQIVGVAQDASTLVVQIGMAIELA